MKEGRKLINEKGKKINNVRGKNINGGKGINCEKNEEKDGNRGKQKKGKMWLVVAAFHCEAMARPSLVTRQGLSWCARLAVKPP